MYSKQESTNIYFHFSFFAGEIDRHCDEHDETFRPVGYILDRLWHTAIMSQNENCLKGTVDLRHYQFTGLYESMQTGKGKGNIIFYFEELWIRNIFSQSWFFYPMVNSFTQPTCDVDDNYKIKTACPGSDTRFKIKGWGGGFPLTLKPSPLHGD